MSSFCWRPICAMWASNADESSESRLSMVSETRDRWSSDVAEVRRGLGIDALDPAGREPVHRLAQRHHGAAHLRQLALQDVDAGRVVGALLGEDRRLDLVHVHLELVGHVLVVVDDLVAHGVDDRRTGRGPAPARGPRAPCGPDCRAPPSPCRTVTTKSWSDEHVDLAGLDGVLLVDVPERLEDEEQAVVVALELGTLVSLDRVLDGQWVQPEDLGDRVQLRLLGLVQTDPDEVVAGHIVRAPRPGRRSRTRPGPAHPSGTRRCRRSPLQVIPTRARPAWQP